MKLSRVERWILANQYRILEKLYPDDAEHYQACRDVLERGYELEYRWIAETIYPEEHCLSEEDCREVYDILSMHRDLRYGYDALTDRSGIDEHQIEFWGFDGNEESSRLGYCKYVRTPREERFAELRRGRHDFNSHMPTLEMYRRMLAVWRPLSVRDRERLLTREQILAIVEARLHKDSPAATKRGQVH